MVYCSNCGKLAEEGDVFCQNCGELLLDSLEANTEVYATEHRNELKNEDKADLLIDQNETLSLDHLNRDKIESEELQQGDVSQVTQMVSCPNCRYVQSRNNTFCENCGHDLQEDAINRRDEEVSTTTVALEEDQRNDFPETKQSQSPKLTTFNQENERLNEKDQHSKKKSPILILLGVILVLLVGGFCYYYFYYMPHNITIVQKKEPTQKDKVDEESMSLKEDEETETNEKPQNEMLKRIPFDDQAMLHYVDEQYKGTFNISGTHSMYYRRLTNDSGELVDAAAISENGNTPIRAASVIKIFVLIAFYKQVEEGLINLDEKYELRTGDKVGGTGNIQNDPPGTTYTYKQLATEMITNSDNTAANVVIDRIGGLASVNQVIHDLGYSQTKLNRKFMDTYALSEGIDNYITSEELGDALTKLYQRELIDEQVDQAVLDILGKQIDREKLLKNLPNDLVIYNKTGQFSDYGVMGDAAIIVTDKGTYSLVALSMDGKYNEKASAFAHFSQNIYRKFVE